MSGPETARLPKRDRLLQRLDDGETVLGVLVVSPSPELVEILAYVGFDYIMVDQMFTAIDWSDMAHMVRATARAFRRALAREVFAPWIANSVYQPDGKAWLFAPAMKDGPFPTHYEPAESPVPNLLYPKQNDSPVVRYFPGPLNVIDHVPSKQYPIVACTFRVTEMYLSGPMSRFNSWLNELMPAMFVEIVPVGKLVKLLRIAGKSCQYAVVRRKSGSTALRFARSNVSMTVSTRSSQSQRPSTIGLTASSTHCGGSVFGWL